MKKLLAIILLCFVAAATKSQTYGNEWIHYNQQYLKFPIFKEGIYRIDYTTLSNHYATGSINPKNFQLFIKGKEQFIFISGESDDQLNPGDYIEFYANPFMGDVDSLLYTNIRYVPNPYAPLFNDTLYAFLTLNTSLTNKRFVVETDTDTIPYPAATYFYTHRVYAPNSEYNSVNEFAFDVSDPHYTQAEGKGLRFAKGNTVSSSFSGLNPYTALPLPFFLDVNYSGNSINTNGGNDHQIQIHYSDQNGSPVQLADTIFRGFAAIRKTFTLNAQTMNSVSNVSLSSLAAPAFAGFSNNTLLHYARFYYPHNLDLNNESSFKITVSNASGSPKQFFSFSNFNFGATNPVLLYDVTHGRKITTFIAGSQVKAVVPNGVTQPECYLASGAAVIPVTTLYNVTASGNFTNYKNTSITYPYLLIYPLAFESSAQDYKNYRQSAGGGGYQVIAASVEELYQQFGFGVNKHPVAIRNFCKFMWDSLTVKPVYVFLLGKGVSPVNLGASAQIVNFIPSMGIPASDNLLTSALSNSSTGTYFPEIPVGRLAAITNQEVTTYLTKVQQHESTGAEDWKKRALHFVGGDTPELAATLSAYMSTYEQVFKDTLFGGEVLTFKKNTTAPVQTNISDSIRNTITNGAALINFFGHGSEQGFDQAIDDPEQYNNKGKYPFIIANSCYSGDIHVPTRRSVSERFVFSNQKGSIGFLATTSYGFVYSLNNYTGGFYKALSVTKYNSGVGDLVKEASYQNSFSGDPITRFTGLDMTLNGDPAIRISNGTLPDYQVKNNGISFDLKKHSDSVGVKITIKNAGKAVRDSFIVKIERLLPNGDSTKLLKKIHSPFFKDSLVFFLPIDFSRGIGLNRFRVNLDEFGDVMESNESNNSTTGTVDLFIPGGDVIPVYPYKFAVVPKTNTLVLKASTTDPFAPTSTYRFQLDTCDRFINPIQSTLISSSGGVLEWTVSLPLGDSAVYFWRVSRDSTGPQTPFSWRESSFQTLGAKNGWGQAHFHQFKNNGYRFVNYKKTLRQFLFENNKRSVFCKNGMYLTTGIGYALDNNILSYWGCGPDGWNIAVFDSISGEPQTVVSAVGPSPGIYNNCVCVSNQVLSYYSFGASNYCGITSWKTDLENFLNAIAPNNYVLAFTVGPLNASQGYAQITTYNNALYTAFESIGAATIRNVSDTVPYILFGKKGMSAGQGNEVVGASYNQVISLRDSIQTRWNSGYIASEQIGPAYKWNSLHWRVKSLDNVGGDTTLLKLVGIKTNGQTDTLQTFPTDSLDVLALSNYADASIYPYLKLVAFMKDNVNRTSPQLKRWQVLYDEAPECAINPLKGFVSVNDTLQEGDEATFRFPIENIGKRDFTDSLVITYWIEDPNRNKVPLPQKIKAPPFVPGQTLIDTVKINSYQMTGSNALWIYVNPVQNSRYQREQSQFNNVGRYPFKVNKDITNPLMDVTFDGVRILNGDIVSARPNILITLKDENKFLALNDTGAFSLFLQPPNQTQQQRIYFGQGLVFTPGSLPKNSCSIQYNPVLALDGKYTLVVQAKDRSRNNSGSQDYRIQFEVNNKPTVTNVLNYPNPFSTSTKFVFTLTGSEVPEVFTIQIMTITGKMVREITRGELGNIHIGRNITDYAWDGRDNFGDRLANGVYLYRVVTRLNGSSIEKSASGADKYITKEFGKMVLMR